MLMASGVIPSMGFSMDLAEALQKRPRQQRNILSPFAQRRQLDGNDAQSIVQVFAKFSRGDGLVQVLVRGRDHAHIHFGLFVRPDGTDFALLQDAEQLHLHREAHVSDLVEKKRAAIGGLEQALAILVRAGKCAFHVPEQFRFEKRFRKRAAIDGDEGLFAARAVFVNRAGHQFLAGAGLSGDQHAAGLRRDGHNHVEDRAHLCAVTDDVVLAGKAPQFPPQISRFILKASVSSTWRTARRN